MKVLYFARTRELLGSGQEELCLPEGVRGVEALRRHLCGLSARHALALGNRQGLLRVAVNQRLVGEDHPLAEGDEVAFFPPVTGG